MRRLRGRVWDSSIRSIEWRSPENSRDVCSCLSHASRCRWSGGGIGSRVVVEQTDADKSGREGVNRSGKCVVGGIGLADLLNAVNRWASGTKMQATRRAF